MEGKPDFRKDRRKQLYDLQMKKLFFIPIILLTCIASAQEETIVSYDKTSLPVLNENFRRNDERIRELEGRQDTFTNLSDTPDSYTGNDSFVPSVNSSEDELELKYKVIDDDTMAAASATTLSTSESMIAYIHSYVQLFNGSILQPTDKTTVSATYTTAATQTVALAAGTYKLEYHFTATEKYSSGLYDVLGAARITLGGVDLAERTVVSTNANKTVHFSESDDNQNGVILVTYATAQASIDLDFDIKAVNPYGTSVGADFTDIDIILFRVL